MTPKTDTLTLIKAMRCLADDIQSDDGVANAAISEAADRLAELERENAALRTDKERLDWLESLHSLWEGTEKTGPVFLTRAAIDAARKEEQP